MSVVKPSGGNETSQYIRKRHGAMLSNEYKKGFKYAWASHVPRELMINACCSSRLCVALAIGVRVTVALLLLQPILLVVNLQDWRPTPPGFVFHATTLSGHSFVPGYVFMANALVP
ncbi:hypothetical protein DFH94DRAFT_681419 [Russula ochroleuca]|uniref:Uncharacterized protein n=1 Tax=Russula ochroleuca TaxID=152965 RepID=A0A9P5T997_9AGAM|nr:hypothetical protein DFH94DRAFT_681419 [Russula ochroleuca]